MGFVSARYWLDSVLFKSFLTSFARAIVGMMSQERILDDGDCSCNFTYETTMKKNKINKRRKKKEIDEIMDSFVRSKEMNYSNRS
jgi:hypothetical protein